MSTMPLPLDQWQARQTHAFVTYRDPRQLLVIEHPFVPSTQGGCAQWAMTIEPPHTWQPGQPLFVSFYQSDNYTGTVGEGANTGAQTFIGHRFKQLLVNGQVVWERDVADEEMIGSPLVPEPTEFSFLTDSAEPAFADPYQVVDISRYATSGQRIELAFRVLDKVSSTTRLPDDHYKRFVWSKFDPAKASEYFWTRVFLGDPHLTTTPQAVRPEPLHTVAHPNGQERAMIPETGIALKLLASDELPAPGFPVRTGVPLPRGAVAPGAAFALRDAEGAAIPLTTTETSHWPDGSVRWVLCEFVARCRGQYRLLPDTPATPPPAPVRVERSGDSITIRNESLTLELGASTGPGVFERLRLADGLELGPLDLSIKLNRVGWRDHFTAQRRKVVIERETELCTIVRIEGEMLHRRSGGPGVEDASGRAGVGKPGTGEPFGPFRLRLQVWAGLPYVLVDWRLINASDQSMAMLLDWSARLPLPDLSGAVLDFGRMTPGENPDAPAGKGVGGSGGAGDDDDPRAVTLYQDAELSCRQEQADQGRLYRDIAWVATARQAEGFVNLQHGQGGLVGGMRWFAEEFPKGIIVRPDELILATMPESEGALGWRHDRPWVRLGRGEAKRTSFGLYLHGGRLPAQEAERFNRCLQDTPRLFDRDWFIQSSALETAPRRDHPHLTAWAKKVTPAIQRTGLDVPRLGHREYWDTAWCNDYRGRTHQGLLQFIETGDPRWLRYFEAAISHNRDVDIIHYCPEHPDWVGAVHLYGEDHTSCGPMGNIGTNCDGMLDHYLLTGDLDSWKAAQGMAQRLLELNPFERCARHVGWPMAQISRWYDQTGDERFKAKLDELMQAAQAYIEPRRGIFVEMHGCWNYRGSVPFMSGYLAFGLIRYHQLSGDPEALRLLRLLLDGLCAESGPTPGFPGSPEVGGTDGLPASAFAPGTSGRFFYSPFPENNGLNPSPGPSPDVGGIAGYLYLKTGEEACLTRARECYDVMMGESCRSPVTMDHITTLNWMLHALVEAGHRDA